ncbi:MAG: class I SAM-dependent methyltransferase [Planctomycetes bacterium]|nr:class I SAM-dependent methyltransferase [Planctomycetota bacterium]
MKLNFTRLAKNLFSRVYRRHTHAEMVRILVAKQMRDFASESIFVETGSGISTVALTEMAKKCNGRLYSCDINDEMLGELKKRAGDQLTDVTFLIGDSIASLREIAGKHDRIDFVFLDSAASAMHTFREFQVIEPCLKAGSCLLIDNAALPQAKLLLSPCRKGKILVPYLLASPNWQVRGHPDAGDSMVSAVYSDKPNFADERYERSRNIKYWQASFQKHLS